jgi:hypothetical protein
MNVGTDTPLASISYTIHLHIVSATMKATMHCYVTRAQKSRNDRNGFKEQTRTANKSLERDIHAFGAYFCLAFFLLGEVDLSSSFGPKGNG